MARKGLDQQFAQVSGRCRVPDMTVTSTPCWSLAILLIATAIFRMLMEWQLRRTLTEVFQHAPTGSIIVIKERGLGGSMWIQVGSGPESRSGSGPAELR